MKVIAKKFQVVLISIVIAILIVVVILAMKGPAPQCSEVPCPCTGTIHSDYGINDIEFRQDSSQDIGFCEITIDSDKAIITFNDN